jgi:UDP-N-acetylmuramoyl-tripeptide--D-alanyl-D-alanine ligase
MQLPEIARALANSLPEAGRQEILHSPDGTTIINDAYNANPTSMRAALKTLCAMRTTGRRIAVLGDMGELGSFARACHEGVGQSAADLPIDALVCVGELAAHIAQGARAGGMSPERITHVPALADAFDLLEGTLAADDIVLVKASHFMELNKLAEGLAR